MPTEEQFDEAGVRFDAAAEGADELLRATRQANSRRPLHGGGLTRDVNAFVDESGAEMGTVSGGLRELASECRKRAQECREAKAARGAYQAAQLAFAVDSRQHGLDTAAAVADPTRPDPGPAPTAPTPPPAPPPYVTI